MYGGLLGTTCLDNLAYALTWQEYKTNNEFNYLIGHVSVWGSGPTFTKPPLGKTSLHKIRSFSIFGEATLNLSCTKLPLTVFTKGFL